MMNMNRTLQKVFYFNICNHLYKYRCSVIFVLAILLQAGPVQAEAEVQGKTKNLRFNQLQYIGTHNSYHIAAGQAMNILMLQTKFKSSDDWPAEKLIHALDYTHVPLTTQLELGMRQFELDVYYDPKGGKYSNPGGLRVLQASKLPIKVTYDLQGELKQPGFKVLHMADVDVNSTCLRLISCLNEIRQWSDANPDHFPIIIQVQPKKGGYDAIANAYEPVAKTKINATIFTALEAELLSVFPIDRIVTPDDVRGDSENLSDAILDKGWPTLDRMAGKVIFTLLTKKKLTKNYIEFANNSLRGRLLFAPVSFDHPEASWLRIPDPFYEKYPINSFVKKGFMVLTQTDTHTNHARNNDTTRRDEAFTTGAHFLLTDYAIPDRRFSNYQVKFPNGKYVRCNPVSYSGECPF